DPGEGVPGGRVGRAEPGDQGGEHRLPDPVAGRAGGRPTRHGDPAATEGPGDDARHVGHCPPPYERATRSRTGQPARRTSRVMTSSTRSTIPAPSTGTRPSTWI